MILLLFGPQDHLQNNTGLLHGSVDDQKLWPLGCGLCAAKCVFDCLLCGLLSYNWR